MIKEIVAQEKNAGMRLDFFLSKEIDQYSRNFFINLIRLGKVQVNGQVAKPSYLIKTGDKIGIDQADNNRSVDNKLKPEKIPLDIIYEDNDVIVVNKQPGLVVHPGSGVYEGTLVNALLDHFPEIKEAVFIKGNNLSESRPGIVHRLDKDTSGVLIIAKNDRTMHSLSRQIQNRSVKKTYWALCYGWPKESEGTLINFLGRNPKDRKKIADIGREKGREAISFYRVVNYLKAKDNKKISLIEFNIKTGRTHQIRIQSKMLGDPVLGDETYGSKESLLISETYNIKRQMLHAKELQITLPGQDKPSKFVAKLPDDFQSALSKFSKID